jgi:two-component system OmpR family sensor kinase
MRDSTDRPPIALSATYEDSHLGIEVSDSGHGFPREFREHAFERFAQADSARSSGGSGLGLALVASVAQAHGGVAEVVESPHGLVRLSLPLADEDPGREGAEPTPVHP